MAETDNKSGPVVGIKGWLVEKWNEFTHMSPEKLLGNGLARQAGDALKANTDRTNRMIDEITGDTPPQTTTAPALKR